jgi:nucleolar protein 53
MGRLQGSALRAKKRANAAAVELVDQSAQWAEVQSFAQAPNEALFAIDTTAQPVPNFKLPAKKAATANSSKHSIPKLQQKKVQDLLEKHDSKTLQDMLKKEKLSRRRSKLPSEDLWQDCDDKKANEKPTTKKNKQSIITARAGIAPVHTSSFRNVRGLAQKIAAKGKNTGPKTVAVQPALAGQSYHPDPQQHQDVIGEALALELRRQEVETYVKTPISNGMRQETKALLVTDDQEFEESEDDDDHDIEETTNETDLASPILPRRTEKLTRAQRNKQKRLRSEQAELQQRKRTKKFLNEVADVKKIKRDIVQVELTKQQRRELIQQEKQQKKEQPLGINLIQKQFEQNPLAAPTLPVALSSDYTPATAATATAGPSLRTVHPKGSLITERLMSFRDRQLVVDSSKHAGKERKRIVQGKKRLKVKGKGYDYTPADANYKLMG